MTLDPIKERALVEAAAYARVHGLTQAQEAERRTWYEGYLRGTNDAADTTTGDSTETPSEGTSVLPMERRIEWNPGIRGGIPQPANVTTLETHDTAQVIQDAINDVATPAVIHVQDGVYGIDRPLHMRPGVVLRGDGPNTVLRMNHDDDGIYLVEWGDGADVPILGGYEKGSTSIEVADASGFTIGGYASISQTDDGDVITKPEWERSWAADAVGQVVRIKDISGSNLLLFDPLNITYEAANNPVIRTKSVIEDAGIEHMRLERIDASENWIVRMRNAVRCWVHEVESYRARKAHVHMRECLRCDVSQSKFLEASDNGTGGNGYGVVLSRWVTNCLVENNLMRKLRHGVLLQIGANGNVIGYNDIAEGFLSENANATPADIDPHGHYSYANLIEGNDCGHIRPGGYWGPCGPWTTFLSNTVRDKEGIYILDVSPYQNLLGNIMPTEPNGTLNKGIRIGPDTDPSTMFLLGNETNGKIDVAGVVPQSFYR